MPKVSKWEIKQDSTKAWVLHVEREDGTSHDWRFELEEKAIAFKDWLIQREGVAQ